MSPGRGGLAHASSGHVLVGLKRLYRARRARRMVVKRWVSARVDGLRRIGLARNRDTGKCLNARLMRPSGICARLNPDTPVRSGFRGVSGVGRTTLIRR